MEKCFKYMCVFMTAVIILSSFLMVLAVPFGKKSEYDFLNCKEIVNNIKNYEMNMTSVIYVQNKNGDWEEYQRIHGTENRIWVDIEEIPQNLIDAFVSIEDQRFYRHGGVDWKRTAGAFINFLPFIDIYSSNQGGSTITQQLIKNITSDNDESAVRKIREITRALLIEKIIDKTTILEAYLNTISLGNGICGVQVASNYYFNKNVNELNLTECAALAAITKNPSAYNPDTKPEGNKKRREDVLYKMYELGKIDEQTYSEALSTDIVIDKSQQHNFEIPINNYFVDTLISDIIDDLSVKYNCSTDTASAMLYNGGYKIYATIDTDVQDVMESVYSKKSTYFSQKSSSDKSVNIQSAMTIMDYKGNIKGIVGGVGEKTVNRGLNRAIDSPRQPGSTMKPLGVYVQAIENGYASYSTMVEDKPMDNYYKDGKKGPKEWYGYYAGNMTVAKAIERSANTIPCWMLKDKIGIENSYNFLTQKLGLKHLDSADKNIASLALGGCRYGITTTESAAAYAIFGNGGWYYEPTTYIKVLDVNDNVVLLPDSGEQVIKDTTATVMNKLLQNVVYGSQGTGKGIAGYSKMKAYAKTGTSSESKDLWMVAGTPYYVGSVWYGFDQPENVRNAGAAAKVWRDIMTKLHQNVDEREFTDSEDVIVAKYCTRTGLLALPSCKSTAIGYYVPGVETKNCSGNHNSGGDSKDDTKSGETSSGTSSSEQSASSATSSDTGTESSDTSSEGENSSENVSSSGDNQSSENSSGTDSSSDNDSSNDSSGDEGSNESHGSHNSNN